MGTFLAEDIANEDGFDGGLLGLGTCAATEVVAAVSFFSKEASAICVHSLSGEFKTLSAVVPAFSLDV
jgi:hypothetical protein